MIALATVVVSVVVSAPTQVTAWNSGYWFDGTGFRRVDVYSTGERLTLTRPRTVHKTVDLAGGYVAPPFSEAHNHNIPGVDTDANIRTYLEQGMFYVMIHGNVPEARASLSGRINVRESIDVVFANGLFTTPGGHPSALVERNIAAGGMAERDRDGGFLHPVTSRADVDRAWSRSIEAQRPDFIKLVLVYSEDRVGGLPRPAGSDRHGLEPALARYIVQKAHASKLRVSAHVESAYDFQVAVDAGADLIAHMPGFWPDAERIAAKGPGIYRIDDDVAARAGRSGVSVVTTLGEALRDVSDKPEFRAPLLELFRHNLEVLRKHGVVIAIGSDQFRGTSLQEAMALHKAGLLPAAALLRALSLDGARAIFGARAPRRFPEGAIADFLVLDGNPLEDFAAIQRIRLRVRRGRELW